MEIDLLLENDDTVIIIEVKTTLAMEHVRKFRDKLKRFAGILTKIWTI